jgi:GrpB-like predicted nucleotidyltransferase (UPF0157 family)
MFATESAEIAAALGDVVVAVHHVGSTAIPGIFAKPIIDILLEVDDVARLDQRSAAMQQLGYEALGEFGIPGRRYFRKNGSSGRRTHQVHAFEAGTPQVLRHLAFRDYLIAHPQLAQAYGQLKYALARQHPQDIDAYIAGKSPFLQEHEARALTWQSARSAE